MASTPPAKIFLLGRFEVEIGERAIAATEWRKRRAVDVLTTLALAPGRTLHREELIDRFWSGKDLDAGANNLHRALHEIRRITGMELARLERGVARLMEEVWIDVEAFEQAASTAQPEALARAIDLYRGTLLPDDPYCDSIASRREGLRQRFVDAALALARHRHSTSDVDGCIAVLRRALEADPALEPAHQLLMEVLAKAGRQGDARRQFAECVAALRGRLDAQPSQATLDLRAAIERGDFGTEPIEPGPPIPEKPSIAVLPFANLSGDPEQDCFADGISEDIITDLSRISGLLVIARNSTFVFKNQAVDVRTVGRKLGVQHVLEGSVRKAGGRVRITAQLIDASTGGHVWAERFDRDLADIFAVQDDVSQSIVRQLEVRLTASEQKGLVHRKSKVNIEVFDLVMRARAHLFRFSAAAAAEARHFLGRAIEIDPEFAPAFAVLGLVHATEHINGWATAEGHLETGMQYARRALELDANEPQTHHAITLLALWQKDYEVAERAAATALSVGPSHSGSFIVHGQVLDFTGRHAGAIDAFEKALRVDPASDLILHLIGRAQLGAGRTEEARKSFERRLARAPRSDMSRVYLASIHGAAGRIDEARRLWAEILEINPSFSIERLRRILPYRDPSWFDRFADGLAKVSAG